MMDATARQANYHRTLEVKATPEQVFRALTTEMDRWWTTETEGALNAVGDRVKVSFPPNKSYWAFEACVLSPGELVELTCVDACHLIKDKPEASEKEWLGTTLRWQILADGEGARVEFEHQGLTPRLHCYDVCHEGWNYFFGASFAAYLNEGTGTPHSAG